MMLRLLKSAVLTAVSLLALGLAVGARAEDRVTLGWGRMLTNDALGDGRDRWRTGSYTLSRIRGTDWTGRLPTQPGALLEYRLRAETIAPEDLTVTNPKDRRYAGVLSLGLYTHFESGGMETAAGLEAVVTGPQTGLGRLQSRVHGWLDLPEPTVLGDQIEDDSYFALNTEVGRTLKVTDTLRLRPFAEARVGDEDYLRLGGDIVIGSFTDGALMIRESVTGQRYRAVTGDRTPGLTLVMGGDVTRVFDSIYLPEDGVSREDIRQRLRSGLHWQGARSDFFSGLTWLGPEFKDQDQGQILGSVSLHLKF